MTTSQPRISKTTQRLINDLREIQNGETDFPVDPNWKRGFRQAVVYALMNDAMPQWGYNQCSAYVDEQLAKPEA